jgi:cystathionine beta-lyase/cystathionine gamma-synthase
LCGPAAAWQRVGLVHSVWGVTPSPFDCWLAYRGLGTMALRVQRACDTALAVAEWLRGRRGVQAVHYPGLKEHPDHELAARQFDGRFGSVVTLTLDGGTAAARAFIQAARRIPFSPSLGDLATTLSHPESTSHRLLSTAERARLGIHGGTLRLSVGIESLEAIQDAIEEGLAAAG